MLQSEYNFFTFLESPFFKRTQVNLNSVYFESSQILNNPFGAAVDRNRLQGLGGGGVTKVDI